MYARINLPDNAYKTFQIDYPGCKLCIGDRVDPQTVIGRDFRTGETVTANCWGYITATRLNPLNHHLLVFVSGLDELRWDNVSQLSGIF